MPSCTSAPSVAGSVKSGAGSPARGNRSGTGCLLPLFRLLRLVIPTYPVPRHVAAWPGDLVALGVAALACRNGGGQRVLLWWNRAAIVGTIRAIGVVGQVEVERRRVGSIRVLVRFDLKIAAGAICLASRGGIAERHKELVRVVLLGISETEKTYIPATNTEAQLSGTRLWADLPGGGSYLHDLGVGKWHDLRFNTELRVGRIVAQARKVPRMPRMPVAML